ncbi:MAG: fibronectin type III domain-containing protein, partial [Chloroflexi bacterium]|nr:fibronectin type III domain-containing protein [Chloroflexota bacterium]
MPRPLFVGGALALLVGAALITALLWSGGPASAQDDGDTEVPARPTGLRVATEPSSLDVSADWDDVAGADDYLVRWRPKDGQLNDGVRVTSSSAAVTVADYGRWVMRVRACNDAGCGKP